MGVFGDCWLFAVVFWVGDAYVYKHKSRSDYNIISISMGKQMNKKLTTTCLIGIIAIATVSGYLVYTNHISPNNNLPELRIFIAASLTHVVENMTQEFEQNNNCKLIINTGSSSALYQQIITGSPADVFMTADNKWTNQLKTDNLLHNDPIDFTTNNLEVIITPNNPANITSLADLTKPGVKLVIADPTVPAGNYANQTIWKIDSTWGNPNNPNYIPSGQYINYNTSLYKNIKSYETNVENVVGAVSLSSQTGLYDAGIVYASDGVYGTMTNQPTQFLTIPPDVNQKATYGIAIIDQTNQPELAQKFVTFWTSNQGQTLLAQYGFGA